jgi:hypothetical protein
MAALTLWREKNLHTIREHFFSPFEHLFSISPHISRIDMAWKVKNTDDAHFLHRYKVSCDIGSTAII